MPIDYANGHRSNGHQKNGQSALDANEDNLRTEKRLYRRYGRVISNDSAPEPRHRDADGRVRPRTLIHNTPTPAKDTLEETYQDALDLIAGWRPLRAAALQDDLQRIDATHARYLGLKSELQEQEQYDNEEARRADEWIDQRVNDLRRTRNQIASEHDAEVALRTKTLAEVREKVALARAMLGDPLPEGQYGDADDDLPKSETGIQVSTAQTTASSPAARSRAELVDAGRTVSSGLGSLWKKWRETRKPSASVSLSPAASPETADLGAIAAGQQTGRNFAYQPLQATFPIEHGRSQAAPSEAIAVQQGLIIPASPTRFVYNGTKLLKLLALIACGSIFGISVALLTHVVTPDQFSGHHFLEKHGSALGAFCALGLAMFWLLGQVVHRVSLLTAENFYGSMLAQNRNEPDKIGLWLQRAAWGSGVFLAVSALALVSIESVVEKFGIVQAFLSGQASHFITLGQSHAPTPPNILAQICLALMASLPFALLHIAEGWMEGRAHSIKARLTGLREQQAWEIATGLHAEYLAEAQTQRTALVLEAEAMRTAQREQEIVAHAEAKRDENAQREKEKKHAQAEYERAQEKSQYEEAQARVRAEEERLYQEKVREAEAAKAQVQPEPTVTETPKEEPEDWNVTLAVFEERAREAYARLREARAKRQDALAWYEKRMEECELDRARERRVPEAESRQRLQDAHDDYLGAVMTFDKHYAAVRREMERWIEGGWWYRFLSWLRRRPGPAESRQIYRG